MSAFLPVAEIRDPAVDVTLARMEAKIDVVLAQHEVRLDTHSDTLDDHEVRLRAVEARPTISPRVLWGTVASIIAAFAALSPFLAHLFT